MTEALFLPIFFTLWGVALFVSFCIGCYIERVSKITDPQHEEGDVIFAFVMIGLLAPLVVAVAAVVLPPMGVNWLVGGFAERNPKVKAVKRQKRIEETKKKIATWEEEDRLWNLKENYE